MPALLPVSFAYNIFQRVWASTSWSRGVSSLLRCCLHWGFLSLLPMGTWRPKIQYFYFWNIPPSMHRSCSSLHLPGASDSTLFFRQDCLWQASSEVVCINQLYVELAHHCWHKQMVPICLCHQWFWWIHSLPLSSVPYHLFFSLTDWCLFSSLLVYPSRGMPWCWWRIQGIGVTFLFLGVKSNYLTFSWWCITITDLVFLRDDTGTTSIYRDLF